MAFFGHKHQVELALHIVKSLSSSFSKPCGRAGAARCEIHLSIVLLTHNFDLERGDKEHLHLLQREGSGYGHHQQPIQQPGDGVKGNMEHTHCQLHAYELNPIRPRADRHACCCIIVTQRRHRWTRSTTPAASRRGGSWRRRRGRR